jgi:transposase
MQVQFWCVECGDEHHVDIVGAINECINRGQRLLALWSLGAVRPLSEEPAEVRQAQA